MASLLLHEDIERFSNTSTPPAVSPAPVVPPATTGVRSSSSQDSWLARRTLIRAAFLHRVPNSHANFSQMLGGGKNTDAHGVVWGESRGGPVG